MIRKIYLNNRWIDVESNYEVRGCKVSYRGRFVKPEKIEISCDKCGEIFTKNYLRRNISLCRSCAKKQTNLEKYGVENYLNHEKAKQTNLEKYGSTSALHGINQQKIDEIKKQKYGTSNNFNKIKQTNLEKYGVEYITQSEEMKSSSQKTKLKIYGDKNYTNREKAKQTNLEKYGKENIFATQDTIEKNRREIFFKLYDSKQFNLSITPLFSKDQYKLSTTKYKWKCNNCNTKFEDYILNGRVPRCPICFPKLAGESLLKDDFSKWIKSLNIKIIEKYDIKTTILDFFIPEFNIAIDFDSVYWNSELNSADRNLLLKKTNLCKEKNIVLIHIFEDEWLNKREIVKSIIKSKLNIFDREIDSLKCEIKNISFQHAEKFLNTNNIFGYSKSKINIGMFYNEELVSVLSINLHNKEYKWEVSRFCSIINTKIDSFNKLSDFFGEKYIFYVDTRYFSGSSLQLNKLRDIGPIYWYVKNRIRHNKKEFQKIKQKHLLDNYDSSITEWQNMQLNGYDRIWDCGRSVFTNQSTNLILPPNQS